MKFLVRLIVVLSICISLENCSNNSIIKLNESGCADIQWNEDWLFQKGEVSEAINPQFDDSKWEKVQLPHDFGIEGPFSKENPAFSRGAWLPAGVCYYRKSFNLPKSMSTKKMFIYFGGIYRNSTVYINGTKVGFRPLGYISFEYDLSEHIKWGEKNVITVKVDNTVQPGARWYTGTGIYRNVTLKIRNKAYIPNWGIYVTTPRISREETELNTDIEIKNENDRDLNIDIKLDVLFKNELVQSEIKSIRLNSNAKESVQINTVLQNPKLWSPESPNMYNVIVQLSENGKKISQQSVKTGIRSLEFNNTQGFLLNGIQTKLKGVCLHHAGGPLGAAIYRRTTERQLEILREMGCNAIRTAHNPFSDEFLDVCDSMGFLVMNEMFDEWEIPKEPMTTQNGKKIRIPVDYYASQFKDWAEIDMRDFVLRDRNHPSVIMWSTGNEIDQMKHDEGAEIAERLANIVHELDYRPVTNGVNGYGWNSWPSELTIASSDILGYNYIKEEGFEKERSLHPLSPAVVTECESAQSFYPRSTYLFGEDKEKWWTELGYEHNEAYDWVESRGYLAESGIEAWRAVKKRDHIMGQFIWTGWDYLGEVIPFGWPARSSSFAPIDLCGFPKDGFYFYQSQWSDKPMVHIFPHWNLHGSEGDTITVYAFTNGEEVELFQDGKSLGKQSNNREGVEYQSWQVIYQPGELVAIASTNGKEIARKEVKTSGEPAQIELSARRTVFKANGKDLIYIECSVLDKDGNVVPTANNMINFNIEGEGEIIAVGNGNNMSHESFQANYRKTFNGKCLAIIKSTIKAGEIKFTATSNDLKPDNIKIKSQ